MKKYLYKFLIVLLVFAALFALTACGNKTDGEKDAASDPATQTYLYEIQLTQLHILAITDATQARGSEDELVSLSVRFESGDKVSENAYSWGKRKVSPRDKLTFNVTCTIQAKGHINISIDIAEDDATAGIIAKTEHLRGQLELDLTTVAQAPNFKVGCTSGNGRYEVHGTIFKKVS